MSLALCTEPSLWARLWACSLDPTVGRVGVSMWEPGAGEWLADGHPVMTVSSPRAGSWADHCWTDHLLLSCVLG